MDTSSDAVQTDEATAEDVPLLQLLHTLADEHGRGKAAGRLGVDRKTLWRALNKRRLTPRLRTALELEQTAREREAAGSDQLELRLDQLERRLQDVARQLAAGLGSLREEQAGLREQFEVWGRTHAGTPGPDADTRSPSLHRSYPGVVTVEPLPDDSTGAR